VGTLVVSHVLNELDEAGGRELRRVIDRAAAVLWVEPGTHADSRALIALREALREQFRVIAPCTHQAGCGLLAPENARHWCHHFASAPAGIMADSDWVRFAQRAGLDLRSVPYSFLVLERKGRREEVTGAMPDGWSRILGEPRVYKGFARVLSCQSDGVRELELQKRVAPKVHKAFKDGNAPSLWRWKLEGQRITALEPISEAARQTHEKASGQ
jgi:ribosomal protein RSM22 (predicted rRNA methylase)